MSDYTQPIQPSNVETGRQMSHDAEKIGTETGAGSNTVRDIIRRRYQVGGAALAEIAGVTNSAPSSDAYGLVVRLAGYSTSQPLPVSIATVVDTPEFFEDTNFVTGDSPVTLDLNAALGRNATSTSVANDGPGDFTVAYSVDGSTFGDAITLKYQEWITFDDVSVDSIRITWVSNSAYRVIAI